MGDDDGDGIDAGDPGIDDGEDWGERGEENDPDGDDGMSCSSDEGIDEDDDDDDAGDDPVDPPVVPFECPFVNPFENPLDRGWDDACSDPFVTCPFNPDDPLTGPSFTSDPDDNPLIPLTGHFRWWKMMQFVRKCFLKIEQTWDH